MNSELAEELKKEQVDQILQKYTLIVNNMLVGQMEFFQKLLQLSKSEAIDSCSLNPAFPEIVPVWRRRMSSDLYQNHSTAVRI